MKNDDFSLVLNSSLLVSTILFYFSSDLWGWLFINIMALEYNLFLRKNYLIFSSVIILSIIILISPLNNKIFFISFSALILQLLNSLKGVWKWVK